MGVNGFRYVRKVRTKSGKIRYIYPEDLEKQKRLHATNPFIDPLQDSLDDYTHAQAAQEYVNSEAHQELSSPSGPMVNGLNWTTRKRKVLRQEAYASAQRKEETIKRGQELVSSKRDKVIRPHKRIEHSDFLAHHGIKGQRWGVRRYQNPDGSLTDEGRARYLKIQEKNRTKRSGDIRPFDEKHILSSQIGQALDIRKARKAADKYRDATEKLLKDEMIRKEKSGSLTDIDNISYKIAQTYGVSFEDARQMAGYAMENYNSASKGEVAKKYPHETEKYGHPAEAGGYVSSALKEAIDSKWGDWYESESKSASFTKAKREFYSDASTMGVAKAKEKVLNECLKELGFPITQANRDAIEYHVFWD